MTGSRLRLVPVLLLAISATLLGTAQQRQPSYHVVIISLDGFPGWAFDDPQLPIPTLRALAARGAVARGMRPVNPTVTWPNHTSMVTGVSPARHGVLFNGLLVREPGVPPRVEPWRDRNEMVRVPTIYDAVHGRGMTTAQVDWVAIWNAPTITWEFRERPDPEGPIAQEMVKSGVISAADAAAFASKNIVFRDHIWTEAAAHILARHRPNLLLFHLLNLDSTHHRYGPRTHAGTIAMAHLDTQVAAIVRTLEQAGLTARTTLFVVSDHGFKAVKRIIRPNGALLRAGLQQVTDGKVTAAQAYFMSEGGTGIVYVTVPDTDGQLLVRAKQALAGIEGIDRVIEPAEFASLGLPAPEASGQMGSLFITAKEGYAFNAAPADPLVIDAAEGSLGAHGYVSSDPDLGALFIASGRGIRAGVVLDAVNTIDLAPTAARLLGIEMKGVEGRVIEEILSK